MEESRPLVLDVSSDGGGNDDDDDYDWIKEVLEEIDRYRGDGSDGVVLQNPTPRSTAAAATTTVEGLDDDDCVVLDGDPEKPNVIENNAGDEWDDLLVVGEKGQIACRDYPHPRHLCAKFPFTSTPHDRRCHQCYCYVCDSLAPCVHWGNGTSFIDHCHANDKDEFWISKRRYSKQGDKAPLPVHNLPDTSQFALPQQNQCLPLPRLPPNFGAHNQIFRPTTIRSCSTSASFGTPNFTIQGRSQQYAHALFRNRFQPHLVAQHLLSARNDGRHNSGNFGPHLINASNIFKRAGSRVAWNTNQSGYGSFYNDLVTQNCRNCSGVAASNDLNPSWWQGFPNISTSNRNAYHPPFHPNMSSSFVNYMPSQTQVYSQPIPALNDSQVGLQQVNEDFSALDPQFSDDASLIPRTGQSNQHYVPDNSQVQSAEFDPQIPVNTSPGSLNFPVDSWMQGYQSALGALEVSEPSRLNLYSPEPAPVDTGFFFDSRPPGNV